MRVPPMRYVDAERTAASMRIEFGIDEARAPGIDLFDRLDDFRTPLGLPLDYGVSADIIDPELARTRAVRVDETTWVAVELSTRTYEQLCKDRVRARFSFYHELSHVWRHERLILQLHTMPHREAALMRSRSQHKVYEDSEWQADSIAGAVLAPAYVLRWLEMRGELTPQHVIDACGVSHKTAEIRIDKYQSNPTGLLKAWRSL